MPDRRLLLTFHEIPLLYVIRKTFVGNRENKKIPPFEVAMQRLEAIVHTLEASDIPLERLVKTYEEGLAYQKICQTHLDRAVLLLKRLNDDGTVAELSVRGKNEGQCTAEQN